MSQQYSRRQFIQRYSHFGVLFWGVLLACQNTEKSAETDQISTSLKSCDDLSGLSEEELKPREAFAYVKESPMEDSQCSNCKLWLPDKDNETCGKCLLFKGPVYPGGYCTYWAPQDL